VAAGYGMIYSAAIRGERSIRGIPDKKVHRIRITMGEVMTAQVLWDTGIISATTCPPALMMAGTAQVYAAEPGGDDASTAIIPSGCRRGGFP